MSFESDRPTPISRFHSKLMEGYSQHLQFINSMGRGYQQDSWVGQNINAGQYIARGSINPQSMFEAIGRSMVYGDDERSRLITIPYTHNNTRLAIYATPTQAAELLLAAMTISGIDEDDQLKALYRIPAPAQADYQKYEHAGLHHVADRAKEILKMREESMGVKERYFARPLRRLVRTLGL